MAALPGVLAAAGVEHRRGRVVAPPRPLSGGWHLELEPGGTHLADQVVLAAGAGCRTLAPGLPERHRASWAGVLTLPVRPSLSSASSSPWLGHAARRRIVQPRHWQRPSLEARAPELGEERWIVDAGFAPQGEGLLLGQISLVRPGLDSGEPPDAAVMERRLRQALAGLDPVLAALQGPYRQVPVAFCSGGLPGGAPGRRGGSVGLQWLRRCLRPGAGARAPAGRCDRRGGRSGGLAGFGVLPG